MNIIVYSRDHLVEVLLVAYLTQRAKHLEATETLHANDVTAM